MMMMLICPWWSGLNLIPSPLYSLLALCSCWTLCDCAESSVCGWVCNCQLAPRTTRSRFTAWTSDWSSAWIPLCTCCVFLVIFKQMHLLSSVFVLVLIVTRIELKPLFFNMNNKKGSVIMHDKWVVEMGNTKAIFFFRLCTKQLQTALPLRHLDMLCNSQWQQGQSCSLAFILTVCSTWPLVKSSPV